MPAYNSSNFNGKIFRNLIPTVVTKQGAFLKILRENFFDKNKHRREPARLPGPFKSDPHLLNHLSPGDLRVTWLGHSTVLFELEGKRFLTDPVWAERVSPFSFMGPKRFFATPLALEDLPPLDGIIISHDHYDHLDAKTVALLAKKGNRFFCPLGVGNWLTRFGVPPEQWLEFDWWDEQELGDGFKIAATPSRHFSGRWLTDRYKTLWASWVIAGPNKRLYYSADSGMFPTFEDIGKMYGPFDLTAIEIGAAHEDWEDIHMGPEKAARAHQMLQGKFMLPIHWGTFNLAPHPWEEPIETLVSVSRQKGIPLIVSKPGETVRIHEAYNSEWWKDFI